MAAVQALPSPFSKFVATMLEICAYAGGWGRGVGCWGGGGVGVGWGRGVGCRVLGWGRGGCGGGGGGV